MKFLFTRLKYGQQLPARQSTVRGENVLEVGEVLLFGFTPLYGIDRCYRPGRYAWFGCLVRRVFVSGFLFCTYLCVYVGMVIVVSTTRGYVNEQYLENSGRTWLFDFYLGI